MVQIKYKGLKTIYVGGYAFRAGFTNVKDEDFWNLMRTKLFKFRVEKKIFEVPKGFPLEKPSPQNLEKKIESSEVKPDDSISSFSKESEIFTCGTKEKMSVKDTVNLIDNSFDEIYIKSILEKDSRKRVVEEAKRKLATLKE